MTTLSDFTMTSLAGETVALSAYAGQVCLIVNVASAWGLTPQYAGLRALHETTDGVTVLGFPCNQFGAQEPGTDEEIAEFVKTKYDVSFPMFHKIDVNGDDACDLYKWLKAEQPGEEESAEIKWNFAKFIVDKEGKAVARFSPMTTPEELQAEVAKYL